MIQVIDNVLNEDRWKYFYDLSFDGNRMNWFLSPNIAKETNELDAIHYGFCHTMYNVMKYGNDVISNHLFDYNDILYASCDKANIVCDKVLAVRTFLQCPSITPGLENSRHIDMQIPHHVCLYYINDSDGDTVFYKDGEEIYRSTPKRNTAVIFDGSIEHCSETSSVHRCIVNFNFLVAF